MRSASCFSVIHEQRMTTEQRTWLCEIRFKNNTRLSTKRQSPNDSHQTTNKMISEMINDVTYDVMLYSLLGTFTGLGVMALGGAEICHGMIKNNPDFESTCRTMAPWKEKFDNFMGIVMALCIGNCIHGSTGMDGIDLFISLVGFKLKIDLVVIFFTGVFDVCIIAGLQKINTNVNMETNGWRGERCPVCYDQKGIPLELVCGHSICKPCSLDMIKHECFDCPTCRCNKAVLGRVVTNMMDK